MPNGRTRCRGRGFTLVELLVVIAIIALLIAILLPALGRAKKQASAVACASDVRQVYQALIQYASDNKDHLPPIPWIGVRPTAQYAAFAFTFDRDGVANYSFGSLLKYLGKTPQTRNRVMQCPDDENINPFTGQPDRNFSYSFNFQIDLTGAVIDSPTLRMSQIPQSSQKVLIFEERFPNDGYCVWTLWDADALTTRHGGRANAGFADGHVERFIPIEIFAKDQTCNIVPPP
ncbi:MAG: prepilin-type N-terminal cleavage/methylation domain-containing protein [Tepidisphaerales bacterium]